MKLPRNFFRQTTAEIEFDALMRRAFHPIHRVIQAHLGHPVIIPGRKREEHGRIAR